MSGEVRILSGLESQDLREWPSSTAGTAWTIQAGTAYNRSTGGSYGLQCSRAAITGATGAYVTWNGDVWMHWNPNGSSSAASSITLPLGFRFYINIQTFGTGAFHTEGILVLRIPDSASSTTKVSIVINGASGSTRNIKILSAANTFTTVYAATLGTWYRVEGFVSQGTIDCAVYTESGTSALGHASVLSGLAGATLSCNNVDWGCKTLLGNQTALTEVWLDDLKIQQTLLGYPGPGAVLDAASFGGSAGNRVYPTGDSTPVDSTPSTGTSHFALVDDDWGATTPTDYNTTPAGAPAAREDVLTLPDYSGANDVICVAVMGWSNAADGSAIGANHFISGYDGTNRYDAPAFLSGSATYTGRGLIMSYDPSGAAWTDTLYNALKISYRRVVESTSQRNIASIILLVEDDDGGATPPPITTQRGRGSVS